MGDTPLEHHVDPVTQRKHFVNVAADQKNRHTIRRHGTDRIVNLAARAHIDTDGRAIQDEHDGIGMHHLGEDNLLLIAAAEELHLLLDRGGAERELLAELSSGLGLLAGIEEAATD